mmetsp:Transcript_55251/g.158874  ORF Transcript_55251/g.158874 Transcript_55251/m.158874 type:complete len:269 (+) Transcript_55251:377-1183(+)
MAEDRVDLSHHGSSRSLYAEHVQHPPDVVGVNALVVNATHRQNLQAEQVDAFALEPDLLRATILGLLLLDVDQGHTFASGVLQFRLLADLLDHLADEEAVGAVGVAVRDDDRHDVGLQLRGPDDLARGCRHGEHGFRPQDLGVNLCGFLGRLLPFRGLFGNYLLLRRLLLGIGSLGLHLFIVRLTGCDFLLLRGSRSLAVIVRIHVVILLLGLLVLLAAVHARGLARVVALRGLVVELALLDLGLVRGADHPPPLLVLLGGLGRRLRL